MKITKIIQWDMGHRILNHRSVCKGLHGHRYKAEITVEGKLVNSSTKSEHGMVMDFADIKSIAKTEIHDKLDHGFMVWEKDDELIEFFRHTEGHKMIEQQDCLKTIRMFKSSKGAFCNSYLKKNTKIL